MSKLPSYQECQAICRANPDKFYETQRVVDGVNISLFDYQYLGYNDFANPLGDNSVDGFELRGLTFLHTADGPKRYLLLHKFFNLNQVESYQYDLVKDLKIIQVQNKADGSVIRFIPINGKIRAKSKMSFDTPQASLAQMLMERNQKLKDFIAESLEMGLVAVFELISPTNQIVVRYEHSELVLLQLRREDTGEYLDIYSHPLVKNYQVKTVEKMPNFSWEELLQRKETMEGIEGDIVCLENGQFLKLKNNWYVARHGLVSDGMQRENVLVEYVLTDVLDDIMATLPADDLRVKNALLVLDTVSKDMHQRSVKIKEMISSFSLCRDRREFYEKYKDEKDFRLASSVLKKEAADIDEEIKKQLKAQVLRETYHLTDAKKYLKDLGLELVHLPPLDID